MRAVGTSLCQEHGLRLLGFAALGKVGWQSCVAWEAAPGPVSGSLARHKSSSKSVSILAMACSVLKHCGKQGSGSKVSVEQVQVTFGKFPRTNALSVKFSYDFFFLPFLEGFIFSLAIHQLK